MRVLFTRRAEQQLQHLYDYISDHSGASRADGYVGRIVAFCRKLGKFPQRGMRRDDLLPGLRLVGFERRLTIAVVVTDDAVLIEGIFYGGQDLRGWRSDGPMIGKPPR